jgi:LacI family transcriptional regulator
MAHQLNDDCAFVFHSFCLTLSSHLNVTSVIRSFQNLPMKSVALLIESSNAYARGLIDGIIAWQREHELWSMYVPEQERGAAPPEWLNTWQGHGVIARIETKQIAEHLENLPIPVVDVSAARHLTNLPWVETDDSRIASMVFDHLRDKQLTNFAYCGEPFFGWSQERERRFAECVASVRGNYFSLGQKSRLQSGYSWNDERSALENWLRQLPKPVGIFAAYDIKGQQILDACRDLQFAVPEQVAVIGVDNDQQLCDLCTPPLSSVIPDSRGAGYRAASLLQEMMDGKAVSNAGMLMPPVGIAERHSTDVLAVDDPIVFEALHYIRRQACEGIQVNDVADRVDVSRRSLEFRFAKILGRSPHQEIERVRMNRIKQLLTTTELSLQRIAEKTGFPNPDYMATAFKRANGCSPGEFRRRQT